MKAAIDHYHARMQRVLDHIDRHLDGDLDLDAVSGVAAFSKFHFHRQFKATFGVSLHRYVQLARLRLASKRLADREGESVTDIALDVGYETPDAFARAFRKGSSSRRRVSGDLPTGSRGSRPLGHSTQPGARSCPRPSPPMT